MRFTASVDGLGRDELVAFVRQLEASGFDAAKCGDSICYPEVSDSSYPYTSDGSREFLETKSFLDPFVAAGAVFAVTDRLRFVVSVLKLPVRHPVLVAKQVSSAAAFSDGRLVLGVGLSPWPDDYEVLGVPWAGRGRRFDEALGIVRELSAGGYHEHSGDLFRFPSIKMQPAPERPVPVLMGGHSHKSLLRAARVADGWSGAGTDLEATRELLAVITEERRRVGRSDQPFEVHLNIRHDAPLSHIERMAEAGVTQVGVIWDDFYTSAGSGPSLEERLARVDSFGRDVISALGR